MVTTPTMLSKIFWLLCLLGVSHAVQTLDQIHQRSFKPDKVSATVWDAQLITTTFPAFSKTKLGCASACNYSPSCNAFAFDAATGVCRLSSPMHQWLVNAQAQPPATVFVKPNAIGQPKVSRVDMRTGNQLADSGGWFTYLFLKICLDDGVTCCQSDTLDDANNNYQRGELDSFSDSSILGDCHEFIVPDFRISEISIKHTGVDGWGGEYMNVWFDMDEWMVKCEVDGGGRFYMWHQTRVTNCALGDVDNP